MWHVNNSWCIKSQRVRDKTRMLKSDLYPGSFTEEKGGHKQNMFTRHVCRFDRLRVSTSDTRTNARRGSKRLYARQEIVFVVLKVARRERGRRRKNCQRRCGTYTSPWKLPDDSIFPWDAYGTTESNVGQWRPAVTSWLLWREQRGNRETERKKEMKRDATMTMVVCSAVTCRH